MFNYNAAAGSVTEDILSSVKMEKEKIKLLIKEYDRQKTFQISLDEYFQRRIFFLKNLKILTDILLENYSKQNLQKLIDCQDLLKGCDEIKESFKRNAQQLGNIYDQMMKDMENREEDEKKTPETFHGQKLAEWERQIWQTQKHIDLSLKIVAAYQKLAALEPYKNNIFLLKQAKKNLKLLIDIQNNQETIRIKFAPEKVVNKMTRHLMMDKLFIVKACFEGLFELITASILQNTLKQLFYRKLPNLDKSISKNFSACINHLYSLMHSYLKIADLLIDPEKKNSYAIEIVESLRKLQNGESLLFSLGCQKHLTLLCFTKQNSQFRLEHYNTGLGLENHYRWENTSHYQTCDVIDAIPEESILNIESWHHIIKLKNEKTMTVAYKWLRSEIGKGGRHFTQSIHEEDYDTEQYSGSCSVQTFMALFRYKAMQYQPGTPSQKEAFYKLVKTYFFCQYLEDHQTYQLNKVVSSHLPIILAKLEGEQALIDISLDAKKSTHAIEKFKKVLSSVNENKPVEMPICDQQSEAFLSRYARFRLFSNSLCKSLLLNPDKCDVIDLKDSLFKLGLAKTKKFGKST